MLVVMSMVQMLDVQWPDKLRRERITARLGPTLAADLYPTGAGGDRPPISTDVPLTAPQQNIPDVPLDESQTGLLDNDLLHLQGLVGGGRSGCLGCNPGSNQWVIAGSRTVSGQAMLSNDMHLEHQIPDIWYENDLKAPGFHAAGVTVPGIPLVIAGHNEHVAWGFTAMYGDTQDIYVERVNAQDEYLGTDGAWHPVEHSQETIPVRWGHDVTMDVERTDHGVVISSLIPGEKRVLAMKWSVYDPKATGFPLLGMNTAQNWTDFRNALGQWWGPTQNVVYADDQGHIGYQAVGLFPVRPAGLSGEPIVETGTAADSEHEWQGYVAFEQLPTVLDPETGIVATANARITPDDYPYPLALNWDAPYRNERIWKWLSSPAKLTPADMLTLQTDTYSEVDGELAQRFPYAIERSSAANARLREAADLMRSWDGVITTSSVAAGIGDAGKQALWPLVLEPKLGSDWVLYDWQSKNFVQEEMVEKTPREWLPANYKSWDDLLAAAVEKGMVDHQRPAQLGNWP